VSVPGIAVCGDGRGAHVSMEAGARLGGSTAGARALQVERAMTDTVWLDLRQAARTLLRRPLFAGIAVLSAALGIGANTAIFTAVDATLLRPLPYRDPERLVLVGEARGDGSVGNVGYLTFDDWRRRTHSFESMALLRSWFPTLGEGGDPQRVPALRVSWNYFRLLGASPSLGRDFRPEDDHEASWRVLILSDALWRRRFGASPAVLGRSVEMNGRAYTVVGVMPPSYEPILSAHFYEAAEMWAPLGYEATGESSCRTCGHLKAVARLAPGATKEGARADLATVHEALRREFPREYTGAGPAVVRLGDELSRRVRPALVVLMGAVGFVLLIACANVASLLLTDATRRQRDFAIRAALGAGRGRVVRAVLAEAMLLAAAGGALGLTAAQWGVAGLARMAPAHVRGLEHAALDGRVLAFAAFVTAATGLLFGLFPALRVARFDLQSVLRKEGRGVTGGSRRVRSLIVGAEIALSLVLLAGAGLMMRTMAGLLRVDPGFDAHHVLTAEISFVGPAYAEDEKVAALTEQIVARLKSLPGVETAAASGQVPLGGNFDTRGFHVEGRATNPAEAPSVELYSVTPDYFAALRIPLRRGRIFNRADTAAGLPVLVVSETTARQVWPGADPIGQRVRTGSADRGPWRTVIGVVGDVRHYDLASAPSLQMYTPQAQLTDSYLVLVARARADAAALGGPLEAEVHRIASDVPVSRVRTLESLVERSTAQRRFVLMLLGVFAGVALLMAAVGVYGVVAYSVADRAHELGIRVALGATRAHVTRLVMARGMLVSAAGTLAGLLLAVGLGRSLEALLFGVSPVDHLTFATAASTQLAVSLAAHYGPLRRALRIDPAESLRQQ